MEKSGLPIIGFVLIFTTGFLVWFLKSGSAVVFGLFFLTLLFNAFSLYFFRDPHRNIPEAPDAIVAPADGKIVDISHLEDEYVAEKAVNISIFLSIFDVHVNRIPASGKIGFTRYFPGKFLAAYKPKASLDNEQMHVGIECNGYKVLVKQIAGLIARRVVCRVKEGDPVKKGGRFGLIKFGSRTDIHLPARFEICVKAGQRVKGGATVIARVKP